MNGVSSLKCNNKRQWNEDIPSCVEDVFTTMEPPTTLNDDHVVSWETPNFGFEKTFEDECSGIVSVAWNEGLFVDGNNEVQFGGSTQYPGVRRQWLRYTDTVSEKRQKVGFVFFIASFLFFVQIHFNTEDTMLDNLQLPDKFRVYKLELMVKFWTGQVFADTKLGFI